MFGVKPKTGLALFALLTEEILNIKTEKQLKIFLENIFDKSIIDKTDHGV